MSSAGSMSRFQTASFEPCNGNVCLKRGWLERKRCSEHKETEGHGILSLGPGSPRKSLWVTERHKSHQALPAGAKGMNTAPLKGSGPAAVRPAAAPALPPALPRSEIICPLNRVHSTWPQTQQARESRVSRTACQVLGSDDLSVPARFWKGFLCVRSTPFLILWGQNCTYEGKEHKKGNKHLMIQ